MDNELLVKSIKGLCLKNNISISELENKLGFSPSLISRWIKTSPSLDKIIDIASYFQVSLDDVVSYDIAKKIDDEFLQLLLEQTQNGTLEWHSNRFSKQEKLRGYYFVGSGYDAQYDAEIYDDAIYYTKFMEGYIIISMVYKINDVMNPIELYLLIQPGDESDAIQQDYEFDILLPLYLKILSVLGNEAPDEIKAKFLKTSFINKYRKDEEVKAESINNIQNTPKKKKKIIFVSNPHNQSLDLAIDNVLENSNGCILYDISNCKVVEQDKTIGITDVGKNFYITHKENLGNIKQAKMFGGKILILIASTKVMKLSGFSSGEQHGNIGYDGLLYVLKDAGFDISDESIIDKENFSISKKQQ